MFDFFMISKTILEFISKLLINESLLYQGLSIFKTQNLISEKWKIIILWYISEKTMRFNELQRLFILQSMGDWGKKNLTEKVQID
jgi:DNA-binding HxlR family transcriptional regulator